MDFQSKINKIFILQVDQDLKQATLIKPINGPKDQILQVNKLILVVFLTSLLQLEKYQQNH